MKLPKAAVLLPAPVSRPDFPNIINIKVVGKDGWNASVIPTATSSCNKSAVYNMDRPSFTGSAASMSCGSGKSRNHTISWEYLRNGYVAALNPSGVSCTDNLKLLYTAANLAYDSSAASNACASSNISNNSVTSADETVLKALNSSINNLRCGYSGSNQSISSTIDVPCSDQTYNASGASGAGIYIDNTTAEQIDAYMSINTSCPNSPSLYTTSTSCTGGTCSANHAQSSDCSSDVGSSSLAAYSGKVYYKNSLSGWTQFT